MAAIVKRHVLAQWNDYRANVLGPHLTPSQEVRAQAAFYAGAVSALATLATHTPGAADVPIFQSVKYELEQYFGSDCDVRKEA